MLHTARFQSHRRRLCLSRLPLRHAALGTGCAPLLQCLSRLSLASPGVAKSSACFGWGKGRDVTSAGWQVTLYDLVWHTSSCSGEACCILLYTITHIVTGLQFLADYGASIARPVDWSALKSTPPWHRSDKKFFCPVRTAAHVCTIDRLATAKELQRLPVVTSTFPCNAFAGFDFLSPA